MVLSGTAPEAGLACFHSHLVGDLACIMLDGKLWQWHLRLRVERVGAMVVVALLQECVVCGLWARETKCRWWLGTCFWPSAKFFSPDCSAPQKVLEKNGMEESLMAIPESASF